MSRPVLSTAGTWTADGWSAWQRVDGSHDFSTRWPAVIAAGNAFHEALGEVARPSFLDDRQDVWSVGDRAAWDEQPLVVLHAELEPLVEQILGFVSPSGLPSQVIHGDLTGNVLFADSHDPAIIDFVPYWRPVEFATAIVIADAIAWHQAGPGLTRLLPSVEDPRSMLARASIYRLVTADRAAAERVADRVDVPTRQPRSQRTTPGHALGDVKPARVSAVSRHRRIRVDSTARHLNHCLVEIRRARDDDAAAISLVHVRSWQETYRGLLPQDYLDALDPARRVPLWERTLAGTDWPSRRHIRRRAE